MGGFSTFGDAAIALMSVLNQLHALDAWFITRPRRGDWVVTHVHGTSALAPGATLPIGTAARERILHGVAPEATPASADPDRAFVGAPLIVRNELYGTLCGFDSRLISADVPLDISSITTAARLLSTFVQRELDADDLLQRAERAEAEALIDDLTGLFNRRGWARLVEREERRSARYAHGAIIVMMDVDGLKDVNDRRGHAAGDAFLVTVASAIRAVIREHDVAARIGGDEFALLAVEYDDAEAYSLRQRLEAEFARRELTVSLGVAQRHDVGGLRAAIERADAAMYQSKSARRNLR